MSVEETKKIQSKLLDMYKNLSKLLESKSIKYFAIGGTAIGAIREKGFIPWDDDIDLVIYEKDMKEFEAAISSSQNLSLNPNKNSDQWHTFYKVYDVNTKIDSGGLKTNLFIDVMIAQDKRNFSKFRFVRKETIQFLANLKKWNFAKAKSAEGIFPAIGYQIAKLLLFWVPKKYIQKRIKNICLDAKIIEKNSNKKWLYHARLNESIDVEPIKKYKFEDTIMPVSENFQKNYKSYFGNIMIKPKNDKDKYNHDNKII